MWDLLSGHATSTGASGITLWVALLTVAIKVFLTIYIRRLGKETNNPVVEAMAYDHRNDLMSASAASLGIFLGQRGLPWVDPLAGAIVAILILRTGIYILRESSGELMDAVPSKELAEQISGLLQKIAGVEQLHELQAHRFGPHSVVNMTIGVDGNLSVQHGDEIASQVEALICEEIPNISRVHVHYHPADEAHQNLTLDQILAEGRRRVAG
jgi:cation diffusion facilitator family transporter